MPDIDFGTIAFGVVAVALFVLIGWALGVYDSPVPINFDRTQWDDPR